ncbi:MAG: hypothetical protein C4570_00640 [Ammonifex sp.]|jgi:hypothetical protein|nr:MAG: hypothetical protein C4570_00640 [Ammonifex sp.]
MRRISIVTILFVVVTTTGCLRAADPPSPAPDSAAGGTPPSLQTDAYGEEAPDPITEQKLQPDKDTAGDVSPEDSLALKSETPVADAEAERILKDLEKELDALVQAIKACENITDEDLNFPGVEQ